MRWLVADAETPAAAVMSPTFVLSVLRLHRF